MKMSERLKMLEGRLVAELQLSAEQAASVREIIHRYAKQRKAVRKKYKPEEKEARKAELIPLRQALRKEVAQQLNPEQKKIYKANKKTYIGMLRNPDRQKANA